MKYLSYHDIGSLQGTCTYVANRVMDTPVSRLVTTTIYCANMAQALWDMSRGRCNYSEFTAEEFEVLKECGDAEKDARQGNSEVRIIPNFVG